MNDLYAIDPSAPADFRDFVQLMRVFDTGQGRFIVDFPINWVGEVQTHMKSMTDIQKMQMCERWVQKGRNAIVPPSSQFHPSRSWTWSENALLLSDSVKNLIGPKGCPAHVVSLEKALSDPDGFPDARGAHIPRTAIAYATAARPLLQTSPKVVLVDPYFKLRYKDDRTGKFVRSHRHWNSLGKLLSEAVKWHRVEVFKLMVSEEIALEQDIEGEDFSRDLEALAHEVGAIGCILIEWGVLDKSVSTERHPRYLLGNKSGLHFDWGFDTGDANTTNHIEWMGESVLNKLLDNFFDD
jgi:hypothetical protein